MVRRVIKLYLISMFKYKAFQQPRITSHAALVNYLRSHQSLVPFLSLELLGVTNHNKELDTTKLGDGKLIVKSGRPSTELVNAKQQILIDAQDQFTFRFSGKSQVLILKAHGLTPKHMFPLSYLSISLRLWSVSIHLTTLPQYLLLKMTISGQSPRPSRRSLGAGGLSSSINYQKDYAASARRYDVLD